MIEHGGNKYPCTVRDISSTGAALEFSDLVSQILRLIPETVTLVIPEDKLRLSCRVAWHRNYKMGVAFE
jgi:hypothetical protein